MFLYSKDSLDLLRERIDLAEVVSSHIPLSKAGAAYKARCPFHEEKTPSFTIQKGDSHYHCYGCGAHGDAIAFLMGYLKMGFVEAIESLADRFQVTLEKLEDAEKEKGPSKALLKQALDKACRFYHFCLLHTKEGQTALHYLYDRGIDLGFIRQFQVGYAPKQGDVIGISLRDEGFSDEILEQAGLISITSFGKKRDFFSERITFPIRDALGAVIGFSSRKFREETFGGKYINTPETPVFKKSHVLFGLSYCRQQIAKERRAIVVEGQIDALRLIYSGFGYTVAGQGTAFGEGHVKELVTLGVNHVYLALDGDKAGKEATVKIGDLFQQKGIDVSVVNLPEGSDPDSFLKEKGPETFTQLLAESKDYLSFLYAYLSGDKEAPSPSKKNEVVETIASKIRKWEHPVMVHESLRQLAEISHIPEATLGMGVQVVDTFVKKNESVSKMTIDPNRILETDLLRWLFLSGESSPQIIEMARRNIKKEHLRSDSCAHLYESYLQAHEANLAKDLLSLATRFENEEQQALLSVIMQKKINLQKAEEGIKDTIHKILLRHWMEQREAIKIKIQNSNSSEEEVLDLARQFDELKKNPPQVLS